MPPQFPRILRYVAVDETCRDRLILEHAIPEERIRLLLNSSSILKRFQPRTALPTKPTRALVFSNYASEGNILPTLGPPALNPTYISTLLDGQRQCHQPTRTFAPELRSRLRQRQSRPRARRRKRRGELATAVGVGPMVTTENMEQLRRLNFGIRVLRDPMEAQILVREIDRDDLHGRRTGLRLDIGIRQTWTPRWTACSISITRSSKSISARRHRIIQRSCGQLSDLSAPLDSKSHFAARDANPA